MVLHHNGPIEKFAGQYHFLSNFYPVTILVQGAAYPTLEHAYQAEKTNNFIHKCQIRMANTPGAAKRLGRVCDMRKDWDDVKYDVMLRLLRLKFNQLFFKRMLMQTGERQLIEGNTWGDTYWGVCDGEGENNLGKLIMQVRKELRDGGP
jgi:ribA/ribD-fused uncharacterized protein